MANLVWFVPGFMGSTLSLYRQSVLGTAAVNRIAPLWGSIPSIPYATYLNLLALPGSIPSGQVILADGLAPSSLGGYSDFVTWMAANLPTGWQLAPWPFDWRQSARDLGRDLANQLEYSQNQGNTNYVIAHSQGALVAWSAWAALVDDSRGAAMSRLVTFGGALYGTNSTPSIFREEEASLDQLLILQNILSALRSGGAALIALGGNSFTLSTAFQTLSKQGLLNLVASWPAIYDLYPDYSMLDDPNDTNRPWLWDPAKWSAALVPPNFTLAQTEVTRVHQWLRVTKYLPPSNVAAHIVGKNTATAFEVQAAQPIPPASQNPWLAAALAPPADVVRRSQLPWWTSTTNGDGRCTLAQQQFPAHYFQEVSSAHASMQDDPVVRQLLVEMLQMVLPTPPLPNPLAVEPIWDPPPALPQVPQYLFDNNPVDTTPRIPPLPVRVGGDP